MFLSLASPPSQECPPKPTKIILVVSEKNVLWEEAYFRVMGFKVVTGSPYLGSFIGDQDVEYV